MAKPLPMKALKIVIALAVLLLLGAAYGWWHSSTQAATAQRELAEARTLHTAALAAKDQELQSTLNAQNEQHQKAIQTLNEDFEKRVDDLRLSQRKQMATAYKEFENIFAGNKQTIDYINMMEAKVKGGQALSRAEVEKLGVIATGIGYLQKQYQKPLQEFTALQDYFEQVGSRPNEKPKTNFGFFKRMFSKNFREAEKEYYREEGARRAFDEASQKFDTVYASAQRSMRSVNMDADAQSKKLYDLIEDKKQTNAEDLSSFFDQARKALRTHQDVLDFEPQNPPPQTPKVQP